MPLAPFRHGGQGWRCVQICSLQDTPTPPPPVLTSGGYGREASGIHPTLMFSSCVKKFT